MINRHPDVQMSRVRARASPITGAIVTAELVLAARATDFPAIRAAILDACRLALPAHKVPVTIRQVASLPIAPSGKLVRVHA